jgi:hypothetical protein
MRPHARLSIAAFRKRRRAILCAVVPAFAWWSLSAATCFGMPLRIAGDEGIAVPHVAHDTSTPNVAHGAVNDMHDHAGMSDCAHCPPKADDGQAKPIVCLTDATSNTNGAKASGGPDFVKLFAPSRLPTLSWTAAPPPLIRTAFVTDAPFLERTPLNIRHCVFLI